MKTCLITGIDGFTGRHISNVFSAHANYKVVGTTRSVKDFSLDGVSQVYPMDILDYEQVKNTLTTVNPDIVIHLAGISFAVSEDIVQYYNVHVVGTRNILLAINNAQLTPSKLIIASTGQVYGDAIDIDELTPAKPLNDYAISKLAMEHTALNWSEQVPIIIARPFNYIGVGQTKRFVVPKIINAFANKHDSLSLGRTDIERDFSDVRSIAQYYLWLAERGLPGEIYNLASGVSHAVDYLIQCLSSIADIDIPIIRDQRFMRKNDPDRITVNNRKIAGLSDSYESIAIKDTLRWIYEHESRH